MKKLFGFLFIFIASAAWAAPNPADYPVKIHVVSSCIEYLPVPQSMNVVIDGKKYKLSGEAATISHTKLGGIRYGLIAPGDYPARVTINNHRGTYLYDTEYEFLFPDGKTMKFTVTGKSE